VDGAEAVCAVVGHVTMHGRGVTPFVRAKNELATAEGGALGVEPFGVHDAANAGWRGGDELLLPDTRLLDNTELTGYDVLQRGELETVTLASVDNDMLTLKAPGMRYTHHGVTNMTDEWDVDAAGRKMFVPHVLHLTRNIVFVSDEYLASRAEKREADYDRLGHMIVVGTGITSFSYF
jgi:hypothetical protein